MESRRRSGWKVREEAREGGRSMVCRTTEDTLPWTRPSLSTLPNCTIFEHHYGTPYNEPRSPLRFVGPVYAVHWSDGVNCNRGCPSTLRYYLITCITYIHTQAVCTSQNPANLPHPCIREKRYPPCLCTRTTEELREGGSAP